MRSLRRAAEERSTLSNRLFGHAWGHDWPVIVAASHAGIEMDFLVSSEHAGADHIARIVKSNLSRLVPPGIWAEMVGAEHEHLLGKRRSPRRGVNQSRELPGGLSGVTTELIDLA